MSDDEFKDGEDMETEDEPKDLDLEDEEFADDDDFGSSDEE